ncbi:hypothetical protein [Pirellula sp. SH-Sr6A]|uniref:hypothetical protein n=1 Tax=Pirellula sp. SH-Sr6A TaxID=1632865 RepID=UPI0011BA86F1|nr:hypothetical protein [Pirellula sp. SH-Sr6A]
MQRIFKRVAMLLAFSLCVPVPLAMAQTKQRQEQRQNQKVREAEQELAASKKKWTDTQRSLRDTVKGWIARQDLLIEAKKDLRKAESEAEKKLGKDIGLPDVYQRTDTLREQLDHESQPVRDALRKEERWQKASVDAQSAKVERDALLEQSEGSDSERQSKMDSLSARIARPSEMEMAAVAADPKCAILQKELDAALGELAALRKQIDPDRIAQDPAVSKLRKSIVERQKEAMEAERKVNSSRKAVASASRSVAEAQLRLAKAKQLDKRNGK